MTRAIACAGCFVGILVGAATSGTPLHAEDATIAQLVRENGAFERIVVPAENDLQLSDLVLRSDLIVEALNGGGRTFLDEAANRIYTDYSFDVSAIIKTYSRDRMPVGRTITVRRESGVVVLEGGMAESRENEFPSFTDQQHYLLFLSEQSEGVYAVLGGAKGAYVAGESITPIGPRGVIVTPDSPAVPRSAFLGDVRALLKFAGQ